MVPSPNDIASPWMTAAESASYLRISQKSLYAAVARGECRAYRIGGRILRFRAVDLDTFVTRKATPIEVGRS